MSNQDKRFKVIHTFTGRTLFYASSLQRVCEELAEQQADRVTVHDTVKGTFATGATVVSIQAPQGKRLL